MADTPGLSFRVAQLLSGLERDVGGSAPAAAWADALARRDAGLLREAAPGVELDGADEHDAPTLTRADVVTSAFRHAAEAGRELVTVADVAAAVADAMTRVAPATAATSPAPPAPRSAPPAPAARPAGTTPVFRVFVSSTFEDFAAERDALRQRVWPRLRAYCDEHGARFQEVDLRWGVSDEAAVDQQTMNICLDELRRCQALTPRPNLLVLLGDRHGWRPPPPQIPHAEWERIVERVDADGRALLAEWYVRDDNAVPAEHRLHPRTGDAVDPADWAPTERRLWDLLADAVSGLDLDEPRRRAYLASATEQEVLAGIDGGNGDEVVCFLRHIDTPPGADSSPDDAVLRRYVDADDGPVRDLRQRVRGSVPAQRVIEATVGWSGDGPDLDDAYLTRFADAVHDALLASIAAELDRPGPVRTPIGAPAASTDPHLDEEGRAHLRFGAERARCFTGRTAELAAVDDYLRGATDRPLVLHGEGGTGKSALMAAAAQAAAGAARTVVRFVGATPTSSDVRALLGSICRELARRAGEPESDVPDEETGLVADLHSRLARATSAAPVAVFVDSLDQLSSTAGLGWIPQQLPPHGKLVVSVRSGEPLRPLARRAELLEILGLPPDDGAALLGTWLADVGRTLQPAQRAHVLERFDRAAGNPLYLRLAFEEARRWASADGAPPRELAAGVGDLLRGNLFPRLERDDQHGRVLVAHALGYLAAARDGLTEDEMLDLLSRDPDVYGWFLAGSHHVLQDPRLPVVVWARLYADLAPYLTEHRSEGGDLLAFHHRELRDVAETAYATDHAGRTLHDRLADYFRDGADPVGDGTWQGAGTVGIRGLAELPYHLVRAERWDDVEATLTDFGFLEQKASRVGVVARGDAEDRETIYTGVYQLERDVEDALRHLPGGEGAAAPDRPRLIVTAVDFGDGLVVRCPHCAAVHPYREAWRGAAIDCPAQDCGGPLQVNPFVVQRPTG